MTRALAAAAIARIAPAGGRAPRRHGRRPPRGPRSLRRPGRGGSAVLRLPRGRQPAAPGLRLAAQRRLAAPRRPPPGPPRRLAERADGPPAAPARLPLVPRRGVEDRRAGLDIRAREAVRRERARRDVDRVSPEQ